MAKTVKVPITNVYMDGDYTGEIHVGPGNTKLNVILDTGSSALAIDGHKYEPSPGDKLTNIAQADSYGDGSSWTGAVINTTVTFQNAGNAVALPGANVAVAYQASKDMFRGADGILGLAYAPLDDAYAMPQPTWSTKYPSDEVIRVGSTICTTSGSRTSCADAPSSSASSISMPRSNAHFSGWRSSRALTA